MPSFPVFDNDDVVVATCLPPSNTTQAKTARPPKIRYFLRGDGPLRRGPPAAFDVGRAWYFLDANISSVVFDKEGGLSVSLLEEEDDAEEEEPDGDLELVGGGFTRLRSDCGSVGARDETLADFVFASRWPVLRVVIQLSAA
jgi:hypothetical protein